MTEEVVLIEELSIDPDVETANLQAVIAALPASC